MIDSGQLQENMICCVKSVLFSLETFIAMNIHLASDLIMQKFYIVKYRNQSLSAANKPSNYAGWEYLYSSKLEKNNNQPLTEL